MVVSFLASLVFMNVVPPRFDPGDPNADAWIMIGTVAVTTVTWVAATFLTKPEPDATLDAFYRRVRPGGAGWRRVAERLGYGRESMPGGALAWTNWIAGIVAVYSTLFGLGKLVFGKTGMGLGILAIAAVAFAWIARSFRSDRMASEAVPDATTAVPAD
jgi:hypothetical protein